MSQPVRPLPSAVSPDSARAAMERLANNLSRAVLGKPAQAQLAVTCLVAGGHLLIEDVPGVGKTTLAEALARSCALSFARIQLTADLLPSDILGTQVFRATDARFEFRPGPLFHQLVLADELNRAPPRTQSALLEAMAQRQVTVEGVTHPLPTPFTVVATQNPVDFSGTYPLPDSQLDRFLLRLSLGHPAPDVEAELLRTKGQAATLRSLETVMDADELVALQVFASKVDIEPDVAEYAVRLVNATRQHAEIERGVSTRAALALVAAARAHALWDARSFVSPGDIRALVAPVFCHRLLLRSAVAGNYARDEASQLMNELVRKVPEPR